MTAAAAAAGCAGNDERRDTPFSDGDRVRRVKDPSLRS